MTGFNDRGVIVEQIAGYGGDDPLPIGATQQMDVFFLNIIHDLDHP
jgi:hypothetical protein